MDLSLYCVIKTLQCFYPDSQERPLRGPPARGLPSGSPLPTLPPLKIILCMTCPYLWLPGVSDGGSLLPVIGGSGVDQGRVGGPGTPPSDRAWSEDHFYV